MFIPMENKYISFGLAPLALSRSANGRKRAIIKKILWLLDFDLVSI
jgi:hypothetical protein